MVDDKLVAVTGTPGTGKSSVATKVARRVDMNVVDLNKEITEREQFSDIDPERDAVSVDVEHLVETYMNEWEQDVVVDSHLSHFFPADTVIVLRCHPEVLTERLSNREWSPEKVEENVEAEALDIVLQEAVDLNEHVYEVNTTDMSVDAVVETVVSIIEGTMDCSMYAPGHVDWSEEVVV